LVRLTGKGTSAGARVAATALRFLGMGSTYIPGGSSAMQAMAPYVNNNATTDPVRYARAQAVLEAAPELGIGSPTVGWLSAAYRAMAGIAQPSFTSKIRQPLMLIAAGRDEVVSTAAIEEIALRLRAGSHLIIAGARHELMMEQDRYRAQFWAAFDAFVPGTPLFK